MKDNMKDFSFSLPSSCVFMVPNEKGLMARMTMMTMMSAMMTMRKNIDDDGGGGSGRI